MRALIDILNNETNIVDRIYKLERDLTQLRREEEEIELLPKERGADSYILTRLTEISNMRAEIHCDLRAEKTKLHNIRNEIKMYFHDLNYGEEDVMSDGD